MIDETPLLPFNASTVIRQLVPLLLLALSATLFTSCVEGEEEVWINPDGSGKFVAYYRMPTVALAQIGKPADFERALKLIDEAEDDITITKLDFATKGRNVIFRLEASFKDARELLPITRRNEELFVRETGCDPEQIAGLAGAIEVELKGLTPTFNRTITPSEIFPSVIKKRPKMLGPSNFKYTIHLPIEIVETNAHEITSDRKTVSWTFKLSEHFESPMIMGFSTKLPVPWWAWAILSLVAFVLAWLIWRFIIRRFV